MKILKDGEPSEFDNIPVDDKILYRTFYIDNDYIDRPHYYRTITVIIEVVEGTMMVVDGKFNVLMVQQSETIIIYPGDVYHLKCFLNTCLIKKFVILSDDIINADFFMIDEDIVNL